MDDTASEIARLRAALAASEARAASAEADLAQVRAVVTTSEAMIRHGGVALTACFSRLDIRIVMTEFPAAHFRRHRFPAEIITHAVWLYFRFPLSLSTAE